MTDTLTIDPDRIWRRLMALADITEPDLPWTRRSFTPRFLDGRAWLQTAFDEAGLHAEIDAAGNLVGRRHGGDNNLAPLVLGSHSDTVPAGGRFDGVLGVVCALEVAQTLKEADVTTRHPLEVIDFLAEEPSEFGLSCIGSRALAGALTPKMLELTRPDGMSLAEGISWVGGNPEQLAAVARGPDAIASYLEVHIEQARLLEQRGIPIGAVTGIAAIRRQRITIRGRTDHAGATPMALRKDALVAASGFVTSVSQLANAETSDDAPLVATVGKMALRPNAANAIPGEVELGLEVRSPIPDRMDQFLDTNVSRLLAEIDAGGFAIEHEEIGRIEATPCDPSIIAAIEAAAKAQGVAATRMPSGAGHDGSFIAAAGPIGMIFVPCLDGRSHTPEEWAEPRDCATAAQVMLDTLLTLDSV